MRLDKYLKVSRLIKRRSVAKELADNNRILINNKVAKPMSKLKVDDIIEITYKNKVSKFKVLMLIEHIKKDLASDMYEIISYHIKESEDE